MEENEKANSSGDFEGFYYELQGIEHPPAFDEQEADSLDFEFRKFKEGCELEGVGGRADINPRQRLRRESEPDEPLHKRAVSIERGEPNTRTVEKNGWTKVYDAKGNLFRAFAANISERAFDRVTE